MEKLGAYNRISEIRETNNAFLFDVQGPDAAIYFAKVPKNLEAGSSAARQFNSVSRHLKKIKSEFINKVIDAGSDEDTGTYFMILEKVEDSSPLENFVEAENQTSPSYLKLILQLWYNCAEALDLASQKNIFHKDLHPRNILITKEKKPIIIDFGISILEHTISKKPPENEFSNKFSAPELIQKNENRLQARCDFYSLSLCILYSLLGHKLFYEDENNEKRLWKFVNLYKDHISGDGINAFQKVFTKSFATDPEKRYFRYTELRDAINQLFELINHTPEKPFAVFIQEKDVLDRFIQEANTFGVSFAVNERRHHYHKFVIAKLATPNFFANYAMVSNKGNCLEIKGIKSVESLEENEAGNHSWVLENGHLLSGVNYVAKSPYDVTPNGYYDVLGFLEKLHLDKRETTKSTLDRTPRRILKDYLTLLNEEIQHLRSHAFKVKYTDFEVIGSSEAAFKIVFDENVSTDEVNNFLGRSRASFRRGNEVVLLASHTDSGIDAESIGFSTTFDKEGSKLLIKDFPVKRREEIPMKGYLIEDTSLMEIQYKRQINAIKNYQFANITNSELRKYLFQPENLKHLADDLGQLIADLDVLSTNKNGEKVKFEDAQIAAILKSLYRPPITIIQGPPGTGKTTVITEIIRQILAKDKQAKILITSQTNLAVDNVLSRISGISGVSFIRLGRNIEDSSINEHSFENKLNLWARKTKGTSDKHFAQRKQTIESSSKNLSPVLNLIAKEVNKKQEWNVAKKELKRILESPFASGFENLYDFVDSKIEFQQELSKHLGEGHSHLNKLEGLKRKWNSILSNIENYDALKSKYISSINIVGATSNHIAAGKYKDFNFEFDYVIMDEAAKATPAETLVPINMAHNLILVGDHEQLPPLVTATESVKKQVEKKLDTEGEMVDFDKVYLDQPSLFEIMYDGSPEEFKEMLDLQFRMPKQIGDIISSLVYDNKLRSNDKSGGPHQLNLKTTTSMFMCDIGKFPNRFHEIDKISKSSFNRASAQTIVQVLSKLDAYKDLLTDSLNPYQVGVITGYGKQAEYLSNEIENFSFKNLVLGLNLTVATVDSFQGSEKDIIIYDIVRSGKANDQSGLGFLEMPNRINVAFTRATRLLIVVGDAEYVMNVKPSHRWLNTHHNKPLLLKEFVSRLHESGLIYDNPSEVFYG